jgi:lincosamide nucleotidyltransferase A/C/D/E
MHQEFTQSDLEKFLDLFAELKLRVWIDGGWGVDGLLGMQTRPHQDLDFLIEEADSRKLVDAIRLLGFQDVHTNDHTEWNFVMGTSDGKNFDFHVLKLRPDSDFDYGPSENPQVVTTKSLDGHGSIGERVFQCPTPEFMIQSHTGYKLKPSDIHDLTRLHQKFGVALLPEQLAAIEREKSD